MPQTATAPSKPATAATDAVEDAMRTVAELSQTGAAQTQRLLSTGRSFVSDTLALNPDLVKNWAAPVETMLKSSFQLQDAIFAAVPGVMDASFAATRSIFDAYTATAKDQQQIVLDTYERAVEMAQKLASSSKK